MQRPQPEIPPNAEKDTAVHPKTMFPAFLLTAALAVAAAPQPVEIARSPNGRLHILQSHTDDGYTL